LPSSAAAAASNSLGGAVDVAGHLGGGAAQTVHNVANQAFVHAMGQAVLAAVAVALAGAIFALAWLPARAGASVDVDGTHVPAPAPDGEHDGAGEVAASAPVGPRAHRLPTAAATSTHPLVGGKQARFRPLPRGQRSR
ncbi:MAG: hypothetical protein ACRDIL_10350, partial [Candidatus Limnocylindrales bacterium]